MTPPDKLDAQTVDFQRPALFQFLKSLLRRRGGWFANPKGSFERSGQGRTAGRDG